MHLDRIAQIIRFALARARREDHGYGDLGMIHLIKLLYLADLAYARTHAGETYTGIPWKFHHFGPWEKGAWETSVSVLDAPDIELKVAPGAFERKTFRLRDHGEADQINAELERVLPSEVTREVVSAVHEFGTDTKRLLHHVYTTEPMRAAIPGASISFDGLEGPTPYTLIPLVIAPAISKTQQNNVDAAKAKLRESIAAKAAVRQAARVIPLPALNERELAALEELNRLLAEDEDPASTDLHGEMVFSPELWNSDFRRVHGLS
jgi:hypothetical protein